MKHLIFAMLTVFFVAKWGSDSRSCLQATSRWSPFKTIERAKQCMRPGDSFVVLG